MAVLLAAGAGCGGSKQPSAVDDSIDVQYARACNAPEADRTADQWDLIDALAQPCDADSPHVDSVAALRDALVAAGYPCPKYGEIGPIGKTTVTTGNCSDDDTFQVYETHAEVMKQVATDTDPDNAGPLTDHILIGSNWFVINNAAEGFSDGVLTQMRGYVITVPGSDG